MRRHRVMVVLAGAAAVWWAAPLAGGGAAVAGAAPSGHGVSLAGLWGRAQEVPGLGNCAAGGWYFDLFGGSQAFVASERNGAWRQAIEVPGTGSLNKAGDAQVSSVSCAGPAGNCAAGGSYQPSFNQTQAFVVSERSGVWGKAIEVPMPAALNEIGAEVSSVSCASAGNCAAGGHYADSSSGQALVVSEQNGAWGKAIKVPGTATLNAGRNAQVLSVSCASAGNCAAGGYYHDSSHHLQGFVVSQG